jgi:hypothetical protein
LREQTCRRQSVRGDKHTHRAGSGAATMTAATSRAGGVTAIVSPAIWAAK